MNPLLQHLPVFSSLCRLLCIGDDNLKGTDLEQKQYIAT